MLVFETPASNVTLFKKISIIWNNLFWLNGYIDLFKKRMVQMEIPVFTPSNNLLSNYWHLPAVTMCNIFVQEQLS